MIFPTGSVRLCLETSYILYPKINNQYKGKGKLYPRTDYEGPEGSRGIALFFL
jgi:hypothetical protein